MATARHTAEGDTSFRVSLLRNLGGAVGLVALSAAVFGGLGMIGRAEAPQVTAGEEVDDAGDEGDVDDAAAAPDPDADDSPDQGLGDDAEDTGADDDAGAAPDADADADADADDAGAEAPDDTGSADDAASDDTEAADDADEAEASDDTTDDPPSEDSRIDPASVTVQVLDGYQQDGGAAARALAEELRGDGYRVIAENPALRYDATTVLWATPDGEVAARQIAAEIGAGEVREQPGNLSTSVAVHVVVGADRG